MITIIKNEILKKLSEALEDNNYSVRLTKDNFDENSNNVPATVCEINFLYTGSEWESLEESKNHEPFSYNRTLNFSLVAKIKNIRTEDKIQDFNDFIIESLSAISIFERYLRINSDTFEEYTEGFWIYRQEWSYTLYNLSPSNCDGQGYNFSSIQIFINPSYESPTQFNSDIAVEVK